MPTPREVYDNPNAHWSFITSLDDGDFEGQHFDRKEAGRRGSHDGVKGLITKTVSAFANKNREGGLLVLGVASNGSVKGINHIPDNQRNPLTSIDQLLTNQNAECKFHPCQDEDGNDNQILLIYVPYSEGPLCTEAKTGGKAWVREGSQSLEVSGTRRQQMERDRKIIDFERTFCCTLDEDELDSAVVVEFRKALEGRGGTLGTTAEMLKRTGAFFGGSNPNTLELTNAGSLFFHANPQAHLSWAYVRVLQYTVPYAERDVRGAPTLDKKFTGPITKQIRDIRTFFKDSAFFKSYQVRNDDGSGFRTEAEYPLIAVDEAIVNAVAHRDYAVKLPIECESYRDTFVVINPGRLQQRDADVPDQFSLNDRRLDSIPHNPKLIEWLKDLRDEHANPFILAVSEGTRRMRDEMAKANLPSPLYTLTSSQTRVLLSNDISTREALYRGPSQRDVSEFANLFPISLLGNDGSQQQEKPTSDIVRKGMTAFKNSLEAKGWHLHRLGYGRITAHIKGTEIDVPGNVRRILRLFPAYSFQFREYWGLLYLCIDYTLEVRNVLPVPQLLSALASSDIKGRSALVSFNGWQRGRILSADSEWALVWLEDLETEERIPSAHVIPNIPGYLLDRVLAKQNVQFDLHRATKQHSLALTKNASRMRADKIRNAANELATKIFPLKAGAITLSLSEQAIPLIRSRDGKHENRITLYQLPEPTVEFNQHREETNIREGITSFGTYSTDPKTIEIVPVCLFAHRAEMTRLIDRLKVGAYKYRGSERTFSTRFKYNAIITVSRTEDALIECERLIRENPQWVGDPALDRLFLVQVPEKDYALDDEQSPYYKIKRFLLENGIPSQMVDTPTLMNADWKDLNLALNITAKCGVTPWVLSGAIPDADFFVGLSYTQAVPERGGERIMGFANVFNSYGRWMFYRGNTQAFSFNQKAEKLSSLVQETLKDLQLSSTPSICFHHSAKLSREDRMAIVKAAQSVRPQGTYTFVWINTHHNVRLFDSLSETDGSLSRGGFVITGQNQMYLSTTGNNPYRKTLGTPQVLEVNARVEPPIGMRGTPPDMRALAAQLLSLTKLNWASTDSLCAEPITTKYAGDIAYLTAAFLRQESTFRLHTVLERTPWFV